MGSRKMFVGLVVVHRRHLAISTSPPSPPEGVPVAGHKGHTLPRREPQLLSGPIGRATPSHITTPPRSSAKAPSSSEPWSSITSVAPRV